MKLLFDNDWQSRLLALLQELEAGGTDPLGEGSKPVAWYFEDAHGNSYLTMHTDSLMFTPDIVKKTPLYASPLSPTELDAEAAAREIAERYGDDSLNISCETMAVKIAEIIRKHLKHFPSDTLKETKP